MKIKITERQLKLLKEDDQWTYSEEYIDKLLKEVTLSLNVGKKDIRELTIKLRKNTLQDFLDNPKLIEDVSKHCKAKKDSYYKIHDKCYGITESWDFETRPQNGKLFEEITDQLFTLSDEYGDLYWFSEELKGSIKYLKGLEHLGGSIDITDESDTTDIPYDPVQ
jgi:hypothetical protein